MNKIVLLLLSTLIAAPAWAENKAAEKPAAAKDMSMVQTRVVIELKGPAKDVAGLVAGLEQDAAYKEAGCSTGKKPGKTAKITCGKAESGLMDFLAKHPAAKLRWSISATPVVMKMQTEALMSTTTTTCSVQTCGGITACFKYRCGGGCSTCP